MKLSITILLGLGLGFIGPSYAALTKGYIEIKGPSWEKGVKLSTLYDKYNAGIIASDTASALQVQIDLERAQTTDSDIEVLNGFWAPDLYPYLGVSTHSTTELTWDPPYFPNVHFINVQKTADAKVQRKENAYTAVYPNGASELPFQASAIWRYNSSTRRLTPNILDINGKRLPAVIQGFWNNGEFRFAAQAPSAEQEALDLLFVPASK